MGIKNEILVNKQDKLLDKELKPPYIPPKEKLISDAEIKKMDQLSKKVIVEIEVNLVTIFDFFRKNKSRTLKNTRRNLLKTLTGIRTSRLSGEIFIMITFL